MDFTISTSEQRFFKFNLSEEWFKKDFDPKNNHIHFLLEAEELNREKLSRITKFNRTGIGNIEKIIEKKQVTKYLLKNLGEDFSYHNLYL